LQFIGHIVLIVRLFAGIVGSFIRSATTAHILKMVYVLYIFNLSIFAIVLSRYCCIV
jgi:hypothetical protein